MLQNVTLLPSRRTLEFGIYRDGDNNLDAIQENVVSQAVETSAKDSRIEFTVEDTSARRNDTVQYRIADGDFGDDIDSSKPHDMSEESNLASFVAKTLDNAEASGAKQTWIELVDHGGGDGGGLQTSDGKCMSMPDIAKAISDGVALHAKEHPEDAGRNVDGVVANQCLMATMGFADALSHANVRFLAASPETMVAPGVPTSVAHDIAQHQDDPAAMARTLVDDVMSTKYRMPFAGGVSPAAAFDVLDLDPAKLTAAEKAIKRFNDAAAAAAHDPVVRQSLREDVRSTGGMARIPDAGKLPWQADRSAITLYDAIAHDARLGADVREDAREASDAVSDLVLVHRESTAFAPFGFADYSDAVGPTIHAPTSRGQIDPWAAKGISETHNAFYDAVDQGRLVRAIA
jgi:hypothetical protein